MRAWLALVAALGAATCQRTPPEPAPGSGEHGSSASGVAASAAVSTPRSPPAAAATSMASDDAALAASLSGRCVRRTPTALPPPVPAGPNPACPPDPDPPRATPLPTTQVAFADANGASVNAEVVRTPQDNERGLMYRKAMPEDRGMLFDLGAREDHAFWMHNTCIPLDMLFIDFDGLIVGIVENAPTMDDGTRSVGCASRFVLEVNAGWARRHGVKAGGFATFQR